MFRGFHRIIFTGVICLFASVTFAGSKAPGPATLSWTGVDQIKIDGELRRSPYRLPAGVARMSVVISGAGGGKGSTPGSPGEERTFEDLPISGGTYTIILGEMGKDGNSEGFVRGPMSGAGGGASTMKIGGSYVAGAAGGAGGGNGGMSMHSGRADIPGGLGGKGDNAGADGETGDGYQGIHGHGGAGGVVNTGGAPVGGTVTGTNAGTGTIVITTRK